MKKNPEDELYRQYIRDEIERIASEYIFFLFIMKVNYSIYLILSRTIHFPEYPNVYLNREEIMEKLNFPCNSKDLVVVKSNGKGTGFMRKQYDERFLK